MADSINNFIKSTHLFEKIKRVEYFVGTFIFLSTAIGITTIFMQYNNQRLIESTATPDDLDVINMKVNSAIRGYTSIHSANLERKIDCLRDTLDMVMETQQSILREFGDLNRYKICMNVGTSTTPVNHFTPIKDNDISDDEIAHEGYDNMPLNNATKCTKSSAWFLI